MTPQWSNVQCVCSSSHNFAKQNDTIFSHFCTDVSFEALEAKCDRFLRWTAVKLITQIYKC